MGALLICRAVAGRLDPCRRPAVRRERWAMRLLPAAVRRRRAARASCAVFGSPPPLHLHYPVSTWSSWTIPCLADPRERRAAPAASTIAEAGLRKRDEAIARQYTGGRRFVKPVCLCRIAGPPPGVIESAMMPAARRCATRAEQGDDASLRDERGMGAGCVRAPLPTHRWPIHASSGCWSPSQDWTDMTAARR